MTRKKTLLFACPSLLLLLWAAWAARAAPAPKKPIYIGARACGSCHSGQGIGNQYARWLHSKHSQAWAALSRPEAVQIATISGLRQAPQEAAICLGCHATAYNAEDWEKDDGFRTEDGVQCERCHGPGSEYAVEEIMRDQKAAMKAGLRMPTEQDCLNCHMEKGSHVAILEKKPKKGYQKALEEIAHARPKENRVKGSIPLPPADAAAQAGAKYAGSAACGACHRGPEHGHQYSLWRRSPHSRAWAVLATPKALEIAAKEGVGGDPSKAPECLKCHATGGSGGAFLETFSIAEGVGCESCHGPGSEYMHDAIMRDRPAATAAGLKRGSAEACLPCHEKAHGKPFNVAAAMNQIAHPTRLAVEANGIKAVRYKTPMNMALRPGGRELYVTCEGSDSVVIVDTATHQVIGEIPVGDHPVDVTFTPDGRLAFVSSRLDDIISVIDATSREVIDKLPAGDAPHGLRTDREGKLLYSVNTTGGDIWVYDLASRERVKNLSAGRGPWSMALSPDGARMLVTNMLSRIPELQSPFVSEVTAIDTEEARVDDRLVVPGANLMMGVAWHPSGEFAFATLNRTKSLVPMTRLLQGWTITNGLAVLWRDGGVDQVLLDEPNKGFADANSLAFTPDGRYALVSSAGTDRVAVVDVAKLMDLLRRASKYEREHVIPNHLGKPTEFVLKHIETKNAPRGILISPNGRTAYVANSLDDSLTVIDLAKLEAVEHVDLGGPPEITKARFGERLFHSANITFRQQYACASCHPDGHIDGITYDIEADGLGISPVDNRTLRGILDTAPFKWEGTNPSLQRQCGARLSVFFTRLAPFTPEQLSALDLYVTTIPRPPNRHRPLGAPLTPAQRRGKVLFERTTANDGRELLPEERCINCHFPPYFTDRRLHDVGTRMPSDRQGKFDTPHLNNIYDSAPYLHNGMAATLEEIWTVYNPDDKHGVTNDMTKDELNDLIEYLKTL